MQINPTDSGRLVELPIKTEWGPGKIMKIEGGYAYIHFRDCGDRMLKKYLVDDNPLKWSELRSDPLLEGVGLMTEKKVRKATRSSRHLSFGEALNLFLARYPGRFEDPAFLDDARDGGRRLREKVWKMFESSFGDGQLRQMVQRKDIRVILDRVLPILRAQNLLTRDELAGFKEVLGDEGRALAYFDALSRVLEDPLVRHESMNPYFEAIRNGSVAGFTKWPNTTLLPFLAQPGRHMFLRPKTLRGFSSLMGNNLMYEPQPNWRTYNALLEMSRDYLDKLAPLGARDFLDVQIFYLAVHEAAMEKARL